MHRLDFNESRNAGLVAAVSDLALIILAEPDDILSPPGNKTPPDQRQFAARFLRMLANDGNRLSGSYVVARAPVFIPRDVVEVLFDDLLTPRESAAPAHGKIIADQLNATSTTTSEDM